MQDILVLVVEDEFLIRMDLELAFHDEGYATTDAASGEAAIFKLEGSFDIRALVTDINLGGKITGWDVANRARELQPQLPVAYVTSIATEEWNSKGVTNSALFHKPAVPAQVTKAITHLLNEGAAPGLT